MAKSPWPMIHEQRRALAGNLSELSVEQWATPSLCDKWTVNAVLAHLLTTARLTPLTVVGQLAAACFNFGRFANKNVARPIADGSAATLAAFRVSVGSSSAPPGPKDSCLGETLVHAQDIRSPVGIEHSCLLLWVTKAITFSAGGNALIGGKDRVSGLTPTATDIDWFLVSGPLVEGRAMSLLMATTGRKLAPQELHGLGVDVLRGR